MPDIYCGQCAQIMSELLMSMVEKLTEERDEAVTSRNMYKAACESVENTNGRLTERISALEKALNVTFTMLRHVQTDVPPNCTERIDVERAIDIVRAALAGGKDSTP